MCTVPSIRRTEYSSVSIPDRAQYPMTAGAVIIQQQKNRAAPFAFCSGAQIRPAAQKQRAIVASPSNMERVTEKMGPSKPRDIPSALIITHKNQLKPSSRLPRLDTAWALLDNVLFSGTRPASSRQASIRGWCRATTNEIRRAADALQKVTRCLGQSDFSGLGLQP